MEQENNLKRLKICLVGSSGGHLTHLYLLKDFWEKHDRLWVTFDKEDANYLLEDENKVNCHFPTNRNLKNLIKNTFLARKIIRKYKPDIIISTGAAVAVPFFWFAKFRKTKTIFIEVYDRIDKPTLTGRLVYRFSNIFIIQHEELRKKYKKATNIGTII